MKFKTHCGVLNWLIEIYCLHWSPPYRRAVKLTLEKVAGTVDIVFWIPSSELKHNYCKESLTSLVLLELNINVPRTFSSIESTILEWRHATQVQFSSDTYTLGLMSASFIDVLQGFNIGLFRYRHLFEFRRQNIFIFEWRANRWIQIYRYIHSGTLAVFGIDVTYGYTIDPICCGVFSVPGTDLLRVTVSIGCSRLHILCLFEMHSGDRRCPTNSVAQFWRSTKSVLEFLVSHKLGAIFQHWSFCRQLLLLSIMTGSIQSTCPCWIPIKQTI